MHFQVPERVAGSGGQGQDVAPPHRLPTTLFPSTDGYIKRDQRTEPEREKKRREGEGRDGRGGSRWWGVKQTPQSPGRPF